MAKQLNVVMAQLNLLVGAISANTQTLLQAARDAMDRHQADIVVLSP